VTGLAPGQPLYRLLVVDDKPENRRLLVQLLAPLGFTVREAADGREALEVWEHWEPHLIWMDMRMPVMDGYEATRRIKATLKGQATVIVAVTASALEEDRELILSEGCDGYIRKPYREAELYEMLTRHLGVRFVIEQAQPELAAAPAESAGRRTPPRELSGEADWTGRLAALPAPLVGRLQQATVLGDLTAILAAVDEIRARDAMLAGHLADLARRFAHEPILDLIEQAGGGADG
jgi:CheY-like chemotaxis protein